MSFLAKRRKSRETFGVTSVLALVLSPLVATAAAAPAVADEPDVVLSTDFEDASWEDAWTKSGDPELSVVDDGDGNQVLKVADRAADYDGIETDPGVVSFAHDVTYTISARVKLAEDADGPRDVRFVAKPKYGWIGNTSVGTEWTEISDTFTVPADVDVAEYALFIGSSPDSGATYTYFVDDILITKPASGPTTVFSSDFEDGDTAPWSARGAAALSIANEGQDSDKSMLVTGREDGWHGPQLPIGSLITDGTYQISAWVKLPAGTEGTVKINLGMQQPNASNEFPWVGGREDVGADEWVHLSGPYTVLPDTPPTNLYVESESQTADFLVDNVIILGPPPTGPVHEYSETFDFEDGTLQGWVSRADGAGDATVDVTDTEAHESTYAAMVSDRISQGQGLGYPVSDVFQPGVTYDISAWVKFADGEAPGDIWLSLAQTVDGTTSYGTVAQFDGMSANSWVQVEAALTMPVVDEGLLYFETAYDGGNPGNTSTFLVDDIVFEARVPGAIQDLTPLKDTVPFPMGIAIDARETLGSPSELLLKHFNQITPENHMKPEAFYSSTPWDFQVHPQAIEMVDYAQENGLGVYGHVLVWHSQTPDWFYQDEDGNVLTDSEADKQIMRDRMRTHIFNVAEAFADEYGLYGSDTNPFVAWDVINEVVSDSTDYEDGLRRSTWYQILGEEFIHIAFEYADEAFNDVFAAPGTDRPIKLFINDYNTEQGPKQNQYFELVKRLVDNPDAPIDGVGHQFHLSVAQPTSTLEAAIKRFQGLGIEQAVTELDVTLLADTEAQIIEQGHYYKRAFDIFRNYADDLACVTVWGLTDGRSWRSAQKPLLFDDQLQAKPAYYGAAGGEGLPPLIQAANVFRADVTPQSAPASSEEWGKLRLHDVGSDAGFQLRWAPGRLVAYVDVADATKEASDAITFELGAQTSTFRRDGTGDLDGTVVETDEGYTAVVELPLTGATQGSSHKLDVRVTDGSSTAGWNTPGELGTVTLIEELSYVEVHEAPQAPAIDADVDEVWADANVVKTTKTVEGDSNGAKAEVRTLWKDQHLYVLMDITDPVVDTSHSDPWAQDSVEIYVDGGNFKVGGYRYDDTQIRISADNVVSFGTGDEGFQRNRVESATTRTADGWRVEAAIDLLSYSGLNTFHGLDFQVNDGAPGSNRLAIHNWADPTGTGYQSTTRWGVGQLVGPNDDQGPVDPDPKEIAPKITLQPKNIQAKRAKVVTLRAAASGTPEPTVQWQRRAPGKQWKNIKGETSTTLKVKNTKGRSGSAYRAVFTNTAGQATTRAATVRIKPKKAKITQHPKAAKKVRPGKKITLRAKAKGAFPKATVQWQQRKPGKKWKNIKGANKRKLTVVANHKTHKVRYRAVFSNKAGKVRTKAARITVRAAKPRFVTQPKNARVKAGKAVTFKAQVASRTKPKLQWYRRAAGTVRWTAVPKGNGAKKATLRVPRKQVRSGDQYVLIATNKKGWTASKMVRIQLRR